MADDPRLPGREPPLNLTPELVLAQWAAGMVAVVWIVNRWSVVSPGYAWLVDTIAAGLALFAWAAGGQSRPLLLAAAALALGAVVASVAGVAMGKRSRERAVTAAKAAQAVLEGAGAVCALVAVAAIGVAAADVGAMGAVRAVCGAAFLGAVTDSMILGHWYLIDPKLPKTAIDRLDLISAATLAVFTLVTVVPPASIVPAFGDSALVALGWLATTVFTAVLVFLVHRALREPGYASVMSATGLLYVATMVAVAVVVTAAMAG